MPSGPGVIGEAKIAYIASCVPPTIETFLLTSRRDVAGIVAQHGRCRTSAIQLCDLLPGAAYPKLRASLPGVRLVQVLHVPLGQGIREAQRLLSMVDGFLLDSGGRTEDCEELGGTGRPHDWRVSRRICSSASLPVFLAGGLRPENVGPAFRFVNPDGVDVCTGVRTDGRLDEGKLNRFVAAVSK
jgi:phosphoribosylanthranilate isomerase